jgi:hypothetical protein
MDEPETVTIRTASDNPRDAEAAVMMLMGPSIAVCEPSGKD